MPEFTEEKQRQILKKALINYIEELGQDLFDGGDTSEDIFDAIEMLPLVGFDMTKDEAPITVAYVQHWLSNSGYLDNDFESCEFVGMTSSGHQQHAIKFHDEDEPDEVGHGYVYVWRNEHGQIVADF